MSWDSASRPMLVLHSHIVRSARRYLEPRLKKVEPKAAAEAGVTRSGTPQVEEKDKINKRPHPTRLG